MEGIEKPSWTIGTLVEHERDVTLNIFRRENHIMATPDEIIALHVRRIVQTITHERGGRISVHTEVIGQKMQNDVQRFTRFNRIGSDYFANGLKI